MMKLLSTTTILALTLGGAASAQTTFTSVFPRAVDAADNPSPTGTIGYWWWRMDTHRQALPSGNGMPATAGLVHLCYTDTNNFVPRIEYRRSINGGLDWQAPQVLHTFSAGELSYTGGNAKPVITCDGDNVFYVFQSNLHGLSNSSTSLGVYCYASNDRGATWKGPLLLTPGVAGANPIYDRINGSPSDPLFDAQAAGGRLHLTYEVRYIGSGLPNLEEMMYSSAELDTAGNPILRKSDVRITSAFPSFNAFDADAGSLAADGNNVVIIWVDDRVGQGNSANKTFLRVSNDGGDTWNADVDVDGVAAGNPSTDRPEVAVSGNNIVATYQDGRNINGSTNYDNLWMIYSNDGGKTWTRTDSQGKLLLVPQATDMDVDQVKVDAYGSTIAIAWMEEAPHGNNSQNKTWALVDVVSGVGISTGLVKPQDLSTGVTSYGDTQIVENVMIRNNMIGIAGELSSGESARISYSVDSGRSWVSERVNTSAKEVDEPYVSVTLNGDLNMVYAEDFGGSNTGNKTVVTGFKAPWLENDLSAAQGLKLRLAQSGDTAILLFSDATATAGRSPLVVDNMGFEINLVPGVVMNVGISLAASAPTVYIAKVDAQGEAAFPNVPNFSGLLGLTLYAAAATVDSSGKPSSFSDPVMLR